MEDEMKFDSEIHEGIFISQMREQIQSTLLLKESGVDILKIEMPKHQELEQPKTTDIIKMIGVKKNEI